MVLSRPGAARRGEELAAEPDEPARRNAELEPRAAEAGVVHLDHAPAPASEPLGHDADVRVGHVEHDELHRLHQLAVDLAGHDLGVRQHHLVAFAPHRLDEDSELELAAAEHGERVRAVGRLHANGQVLPRFALEALAQLAAGQVLRRLALPAKGEVLTPILHLDRRLFDADARQRFGLLGDGDGVADVDVFDAGDGDDLAGRRRLALRCA